MLTKMMMKGSGRGGRQVIIVVDKRLIQSSRANDEDKECSRMCPLDRRIKLL